MSQDLPSTISSRMFLTDGVRIVLFGISVFVLSQLLFSLFSSGIASDERRALSGLYFLLSLVGFGYYFWIYLAELRIGRRAIATFGVFLLALVILYSSVSADVLREIWIFQHGPDLTRMDDGGFWYVFEKTSEILFQQVLVAAGIILSHRYFRSLWKVALMFSLFFAIGHLSQAIDHTTAWVLTSLVAGAVSGLTIPFLILRVPSGIVFSSMLHWLFYVGLVLWFSFPT